MFGPPQWKIEFYWWAIADYHSGRVYFRYPVWKSCSFFCIDNGGRLAIGALPSLGWTWNLHESSVQNMSNCVRKYPWKISKVSQCTQKPKEAFLLEKTLNKNSVCGRKKMMHCGNLIIGPHSAVKDRCYVILGLFCMNSADMVPCFRLNCKNKRVLNLPCLASSP